ncbi:MAG: aminotransferase class V-fold PLP-dependent enzyme [Candidatus Poribacteria bacterium]|nr:aminotransferase class V-fold PLP-dependent enzyme [Candidatus Poribacteria bacterium]MDE0502699.1 aminotransferase class V-fold PLP-dependent enzyme [Candidatus Poribacteria bacterium]
MNLQESVVNWDKWRDQFPVTENHIYMNHAGIAPLSLRVRNAMRAFLDDATVDGAVHADDWAAAAEACRQSSAKLIHANVDEIAFMKNTTQGILLAANGIDWREGDNIVTTAVEFPANVYPWWSLKERYGVETRMVAEREGRIPIGELAAAIDSRTRVLTISHVEFASGFRHDIQAIGEICREKGIWFVVDAIQSVGVIDFDVEACCIDILAADGHKWLCAPEGAAIFYCAEKRQDQLINTNLGWAGVVNPRDFLDYDLTPKPDATRFEEGSYNSVGLFGLHAAIDLLLEIGVPRIEKRVIDLTGRLIDGLQSKGYRVSTPTTDSERSGIVIFHSCRHSTTELYQLLQRANVVSAEREGLRLSPHFYNTTDEIEQVLACLP